MIKCLLLLLCCTLTMAQEEFVKPGDQIEIVGKLSQEGQDLWLKTAEGASFMVLGEFLDTLEADLYGKLELPEAETHLKGIYTQISDKKQAQIDVLLTGKDPNLKNVALEMSTVLKDAEDYTESMAESLTQTEIIANMNVAPFNPETEIEVVDSRFPPEHTYVDCQEAVHNFLKRYLPYVRAFEKEIEKRYAILMKERAKNPTPVAPPDLFINTNEPPDLGSIRWQIFMENPKAYFNWHKAYEAYRRIFMQNHRADIDPKSTYLHIVKRDYIMYFMDKESGRFIFAMPISYGYNPDGKDREKENDGRTPETPEDLRDPKITPFSIGRRIGHTVKPGMTTANMGLTSTRKQDLYWVKWGMNIVIHGSPNFVSIGTRSSDGCIRLLNADAMTAFELTESGTPVIIEP